MKTCLKRFKVAELENLMEEHFDMITFGELKRGIRDRKIMFTAKNASEALIIEIQVN